MLTNTPGTIIVDGVESARPVYKRNDSAVAEGQFYIVNKDHSPLGTMAIAVTDEIVGYVSKQVLLHETTVYDISGIATPGDTLVYMSSGFEKGNIEFLKHNVVATAYADKDGNFKFTNVHDSGGKVTLWINTWAQDTPTASIVYERSVVDYNPNVGRLLIHEFAEPENSEYATPLFTVTGTCSDDIETVYISRADSAMSITYLMETMCGSAVQSGGEFSVKCSGEYDQQFVVWGLSGADGYLSVENIAISNDQSTCLSGNTMITMEDGSRRRMDELCAGDIVLSNGGKGSRIHTTRRGCYSDYHTLYHFEDGTVIDETHPHRFFNVDQGFWQRLQLWKIGDHAIDKDGNHIALVSTEHIDDRIEMFGIWTDDGTYYANGLLSGAASCNKQLLAEASAEKAIDMMLSTEEQLLVQLMGLEDILP